MAAGLLPYRAPVSLPWREMCRGDREKKGVLPFQAELVTTEQSLAYGVPLAAYSEGKPCLTSFRPIEEGQAREPGIFMHG